MQMLKHNRRCYFVINSVWYILQIIGKRAVGPRRKNQTMVPNNIMSVVVQHILRYVIKEKNFLA
jgi:hypothetical protein